jgi:ankyrin repeat protein
LEYAVKIGDFELVELLLDIGAPLSSKAVKLAMHGDHRKVIRTLLKARPYIPTQRMILVEAVSLGDNTTLKHISGYGVAKVQRLLQELHGLKSALRDCCGDGHIDTLRLIINIFSMCNMSLSPYFGDSVYCAIGYGNHDILDTLLSAGADINAVSDSGQTALVTAISGRNRKAVLRLIDANSITCTETELDRNDKKPTSSSVHHHEVRGDALIMAIQWGDDFVVEKLLNAGASVDALGTDDDDRGCTCITPLTAAIMKKKKLAFG